MFNENIPRSAIDSAKDKLIAQIKKDGLVQETFFAALGDKTLITSGISGEALAAAKEKRREFLDSDVLDDVMSIILGGL